MQYSQETKDAAKKLFLRRYRVPEIEKQLGVARRTLYYWAIEGGWVDQLDEEEATSAISRRLALLAERDKKGNTGLEEMDRLVEMLFKLQRLNERKQAKPSDGTTSHAANDSDGETPKKRKRKRNNDFTGIAPEEVLAKFKEGLFGYQLDCWDEREHRIRNYLKARQIGFSYYFAREAFADALMTGKNKVFLSASKNQAFIFRKYIKAFAREWFGVELKGKDEIEIHSDAGTCTLTFLSTNSATAQGYTGDLYVDEYFWIPNFKQLQEVASPIASHQHWRLTYISTPSAKSHSAYPFWTGSDYNLYATVDAQVKLPSNKQLAKGVLCPDGQFRKVVSIHDAVAGGCTLFDVEQLRRETNPENFKQKFECQFIDDTASVFKLNDLEKLQVDTLDWRDVKPNDARPFGNRPVWIGYDPSRNIDGAAIVVVAPPNKPGGKFRVLEKISLHNCAWQFQAATIKELTKKYNVDYIGIDTTGPGNGVFEMVSNFFPRATPIHYSQQAKTRLVLKAQQIVLDKRIQWDASHTDIGASFMQIRKTTSKSGQITYVADRSELTGHADAAWAVMHALINEGLVLPDEHRKTKVVFSDAA